MFFTPPDGPDLFTITYWLVFDNLMVLFFSIMTSVTGFCKKGPYIYDVRTERGREVEPKRRQSWTVISEGGGGFKKHRTSANKVVIFSLNERTVHAIEM